MGRPTVILFAVLVAMAFWSCEDSATGTPSEHAPVADAGADQTVAAGGVVTLDGTGSSDPDGDPLAYAWRQVSGTSVELTSATEPTPTFVAPDFGDLVFELVVRDGEYESSADAVTIQVVTRSGERPIPDLIFLTPQGTVAATAPRDVVLRGDEAFVADAEDGLVVYDILALDAISLRGMAGPGLTRVRVQGDVAVGEVDSTSDGTVLFDISGDQPVLLMRFGGGSSASMAADDSYLYLTGRGVIWTIDAQSSPPMVVGAVDTGDFGLGGLALVGNRLYASGRDQMFIYDVSDPTAAVQLGIYEPASGSIGRVWAMGTVAYLEVNSSELHAIDVSDPAQPGLQGSLDLTAPMDMIFSEDHAFVADDSGGVRVLDLSGGGLALVSTFDLSHGALSLVLVGNTLAVAMRQEAVLLDVSTPAAPALQATLSSLNARQVELVGGSVVAFDLDLVDLSNPDDPVVIGQIPYSTWTANFLVVGSTFFGLKSPPALEVVDISDPGTPEITSSLLLPVTYNSADLFGDTLYASFRLDFDTFGMDVIDVSAPRLPRVLGRAATDEGWSAVFVSDAGDVFSRAELIDVTDPTAPYTMTTGRVGWPAEAHGLQIASVSSSRFCELIDYAADPYDYWHAGFRGDVTDIAWSGSLLVGAAGNSHSDPEDVLAVMDLTDFSQPSLISQTPLPAQGRRVSVDQERVAAVLDDQQIWFGDPVMQPFDITEGQLELSLGVGGGPFLAPAGEHGLAVGNGDTVAIVDTTDPAAPVVPATYQGQANILGMRGADSRLYLMVPVNTANDIERIDIIDVADLAQPEKLGEVSVSEVHDLAAQGDILYLARGAHGLQLIDISAPDDPQEITTVETDFPLFFLKLHGSRLYGNGSLVFDISTPAEPEILLSSMAGWVIPFTLLGDLVVSAAFGEDLRVYDLTQPDTAHELGRVLLPGELAVYSVIGPDPIQMDGNWAWIARTDDSSMPGGVRLVAVDLSIPAYPMLVASFLSEARHMSFMVRDGVLWAVTRDGTQQATKIYAVRTLRGAVTLREDHDTAQAGSQLSYQVDFTDRDGQRDPQLRCAVTGGSCTIDAVDPGSHTAEVTWTLPSTPGDAELAVVVGNERWSAVATDWLSVE